MGLNSKRARFVQEYLVDRNGAASAVRAGYSRRTAASIAHELLSKPDVQAAVQAGEAELAAASRVTREGVLRGLLDAVDVARAKADPAAQIAAWREIGRMCGFYAAERLNLSVSHRGVRAHRELEAMTDDELFKLT
ncbi:MAG: terminase small subunit [Burkholderiales bacterium]